MIFRQNRCKQSLPPTPAERIISSIAGSSTVFFHCDISVIFLTIVLELAVTVFISLYFQTFWQKGLHFFGYFKMVSVYDWKMTEKNSSAKATHRFGRIQQQSPDTFRCFAIETRHSSSSQVSDCVKIQARASNHQPLLVALIFVFLGIDARYDSCEREK